MSDARDRINAICAALPGAGVSDPWGGGHDVWKVGGKMFAWTGPSGRGVSVKTDSIETATMLIEAGVATRARYLHRSWVNVPKDADPDELSHRIQASYRLIRASLTKKAQAQLPPHP